MRLKKRDVTAILSKEVVIEPTTISLERESLDLSRQGEVLEGTGEPCEVQTLPLETPALF